MSRRRANSDRRFGTFDRPLPTPETTDPVVTTQGTLRELADALDDIEERVAPSKARRLFAGMMSSERREKEDQLIREERDDRAANKRDGLPVGSGPKPAPLRLGPVDALAVIGPQVQSLAVEVRDRIEQLHVLCMLGLPGEQSEAAWARYVAALVPALRSDPDTVEHVDTVAGRLLRAAEHARDGEPTVKLGGRCPHCKRPSLVVYLDQELVRCDRDRLEVCHCASEDCNCRKGFRHTWSRADGSWDRLARMLDKQVS